MYPDRYSCSGMCSYSVGSKYTCTSFGSRRCRRLALRLLFYILLVLTNYKMRVWQFRTTFLQMSPRYNLNHNLFLYNYRNRNTELIE